MTSDRQLRATSRIAGLTLLNAMVFQEVLSGQDRRVEPLTKTAGESDPISDSIKHWDYILKEIDYVPIFHVARDLLTSLSSNEDTEAAVRFLADKARAIVTRRAALRHDLMGRVYHRLLVEAKFLGTYYTSVPAATLLLKLSLDPELWNVNWADLDEVSKFRIGDLACGTGTLLMAAAEAVTDNYVRACSAIGKQPELAELHARLMEQVIYGYDVLPSALHLTASTLALRAADVRFELTHLFSLPLGGSEHRLGSIEFLNSDLITQVQDMFGGISGSGMVTGSGDIEQSAPLPPLDLCVMNPPFTRSVGGNLLFGSAPEPERKEMQRKLARWLSNPRDPVWANSTAGLGSVFVAVADRHTDGRIALVLPKTLVSGVAWKETRTLLAENYTVEYIIASHDPTRWNFSDNTELSEVLIVAGKVTEENAKGDAPSTTCVNLWRNPRTIFEAMSVAQSAMRDWAPDVKDGQGALEVGIGGTKAGEAVRVPWKDLAGGPWMLPCAFGQSDLIRAAYWLGRGTVYLPGAPPTGSIPLCSLGELGRLGPDRRDIADGFKHSSAETPFPAFWGHDADEVRGIGQEPNHFLSPRATAAPGRSLRRADVLWPRAGSVLIGERLWLKTQRMLAIRVDQPVLSNVWWPLATDLSDEREKALVLWLNSTPGMLIALSHREETRGAWVGFKKPILEALPVLDVNRLEPAQLEELSKVFDSIADNEFEPFPKMSSDPTRAQIDETLSSAIGLPSFDPLRTLLAAEPVICLERLS